MSEWIKALFVSIFGSHSGLATLVISMIPIVELRGAIPFGAATAFWGEYALPLWESFLISLAGSSAICVILTFLFQPLFNWLKQTKTFKRFATWIENKLTKKSKNIDQKTKAEKNMKKVLWFKLAGVFCFVALPLPLTGVWTGTCLALFVGLNRRQTLLCVLSGNAVAGGLMLLISYFFADNTMIVFYAFFVILGVLILFELVKWLINKIRNRGKQTEPALETANGAGEIDAETSAAGSVSGEEKAKGEEVGAVAALKKSADDKAEK